MGYGLKQIGVDISEQASPSVNNIPKCGLCVLDYGTNNGMRYVFEYSKFPGLNFLMTCL